MQTMANADLLETLQEVDTSGLAMVEQQRLELEEKVSAADSLLAGPETQVLALTEMAALLQQSANLTENQVSHRLEEGKQAPDLTLDAPLCRSPVSKLASLSSNQ